MKKIIVFHEIYNLKTFKKTILHIKKNNKFVSLKEFLSSSDDNLCHVTFDDAHFTFIEAFKFLKEEQIPTTLFLSINKIKNNNNFWFQDLEQINNQLRNSFDKEFINYFKIKYNHNKFTYFDVIKNLNFDKIDDFIKKMKFKYGIKTSYVNIPLDIMEKLINEALLDFGAHTINHPILANENLDKATHEIKESIDELENFLQRKTNTFAYPNGIKNLDFSEREKDILKKNNIEYAFTMKLAPYSKEKVDQYEIPRVSFGGNFLKNYFINKNPNFYEKISNINIPYLREPENYRRFQLKKFLINK
jgi:peptidoglycan/xylan/chitin deacetylase (PgdA/CDA1 family)